MTPIVDYLLILQVGPSIYPFIHPSIYPSICPSIHYPSIHLSIHLFHPSIHPFHHFQSTSSLSTKLTDLNETDTEKLSAANEWTYECNSTELAVVGTTADIVACKQEEEAYWFGPRFIVKLMGRQRFRLLEIFKRVDG